MRVIYKNDDTILERLKRTAPAKGNPGADFAVHRGFERAHFGRLVGARDVWNETLSEVFGGVLW